MRRFWQGKSGASTIFAIEFCAEGLFWGAENGSSKLRHRLHRVFPLRIGFRLEGEGTAQAVSSFAGEDAERLPKQRLYKKT